MTVRSVHVLVRGQVQGVGYRAFVVREAGEQRLSGFVRNRRNGSVEAEFSGDSAGIDAMLAACRAGPPGAKVETVEVKPLSERRVGPFIVLPTA